jgi:hypothetical protein
MNRDHSMISVDQNYYRAKNTHIVSDLEEFCFLRINRSGYHPGLMKLLIENENAPPNLKKAVISLGFICTNQ